MGRLSLCMLLLMVFANLAVAQNPPRELVAESNHSGRVPLMWRSPALPIEVTEIYYDDGSGGALDEGRRNNIFSVRFTPSNRCSLLAAKFYGYCPIPGVNVEINVYPDNGYGRPVISSPLLSPAVRHEITTGWQVVDLSARGLVFDAFEDFHIGIKKVMNPDSFPHYILIDAAPGPEVRSWWYDYGYFRTLPGDLQLRAYVTYTGGLARMISPHKRVWGSEFVDEGHERQTIWFMRPTDVIGYEIYRGNTFNTSAMLAIAMTGASDTTYIDEGVTNGLTYYYAVRARHESGLSDFSNVAQATPRSSSASVYTDTVKVDDGYHEVCASWSPGKGFGTLFLPRMRGKLRYMLFDLCEPGSFIPQVWSTNAYMEPDELAVDATPITRETTGWQTVIMWTNYVVDEPYVISFIASDFVVGLRGDTPGYGNSFDYDHGWTAVEDTTYMIRSVVEYRDDNAYFHIRAGWNLVSVPSFFPSSSIRSTFPTAAGNVGYWYAPYAGGYELISDIQPGRGCWIASLRDTTYILSGGIPARSMNITVYPGWNLIGSPAIPRGYSLYDIETYPDNLLGTYPYLYRYNWQRGEYERTDVLYPGEGYFILSWGYGIIKFLP